MKHAGWCWLFHPAWRPEFSPWMGLSPTRWGRGNQLSSVVLVPPRTLWYTHTSAHRSKRKNNLNKISLHCSEYKIAIYLQYLMNTNICICISPSGRILGDFSPLFAFNFRTLWEEHVFALRKKNLVSFFHIGQFCLHRLNPDLSVLPHRIKVFDAPPHLPCLLRTQAMRICS